MQTIDQIKQQEITDTALFLFDCALADGTVQRWSTHAVTFNGNKYNARLLRHNLFNLQTSSSDGLDALAQVSVTLANADSFFSEIERNVGWKGAQITVQFLFYDLNAGAPTSDTLIIFQGIANPPDEITESALRLTFTNRLNLQRILLPEVRIQRRCPWQFPATSDQRKNALTGGDRGTYSPLYRCGYSADQQGGVGNLNNGAAYTSCDYTRTQCQQRGMFDTDSNSNVTRRFGGIEFVPASILVRSYGEQGSHVSPVLDNQALYNNFVPLVYGTAWYAPPIVFARNDGNLTHMEVLLGMGQMQGVIKLLVNDIEIPVGQAGTNMTATGWYNIVTLGTHSGAFNLDFTGSSGNPLGDPYGSMAVLSVVVPNRISDGSSTPVIQALVQGIQLQRFNQDGTLRDQIFTNNSAWVILDVLQRSGWALDEIDLGSFATAAAHCDEVIQVTDLNGNPTSVPRYQCNLVLTTRRSAADVVRGIRNGAALFLTCGPGGLLQLKAENTLALQQPAQSSGTNSTDALDGGWPMYEFSDGSATFSGILRKNNGEPWIRLYSTSAVNTPNQYTVEFQDEFNEYQQDSLSLVDVDDANLMGYEITAPLIASGLPNYDQATRIMALTLNKSILGNTFVEFQTSVRGVGLLPGDIITVTYLKEGLQRQPFRIVSIAPGANYRTAQITAQWHDDIWYTTSSVLSSSSRRQSDAGLGLPRPLVGTSLDSDGNEEFGITETADESADGSFTVSLSVDYVAPSKPGASTASIPLLSLSPQIQTTGGSLPGGQTLYYAISAIDANGAEGALSFSVSATIPAGTGTNSVTLTNLSFSANTASFNVYRGPNPSQLLLLAGSAPVATQFADTGGTALTLQGPPDANYDHANFYWRMEQQPEATVDIHSPFTVGNSTLEMLANEWTGFIVRITQGTGKGQERVIAGNTATTLTLQLKWDLEPDTTSSFVVADATWQFGAIATASPVIFEVPNRDGTTVHISGRSANVQNQESAYELAPLTRWQIGGATGSAVDGDVPPAPFFGLAPTGQGTVQLAGVSFTDLTNTRTITAGTFTVWHWNEITSPSTFSLAADVVATDTTLTLSAAGSAQAGDVIQIDAETMVVESTSNGGLQYMVTRGSHGTTPTAHTSGTAIYHLTKKVFIVPFVKDFFGSPASGSYAFPIFLPDARIGAAELFMTNSQGNSPTARVSFTGTADQGLRTFSGGQLSIQVDGYLAIQTGVAPPLIVEDTHAVRDIFAVVGQAPSGGPVVMQLNQNGAAYATLTIPDGATISNVVNGFGMAPLAIQAQVTLDITFVVAAVNSLPGRDLTVIVRL